LRFSLRQFLIKKLTVRAGFFGGAAGGGAAPERLSASGGNSDEARPAKRGERGANALTIFFEMSSNFFENVHHFGNCGLIGCGARNAGVRCERRKGKIQLSAKTA